MQKCFGGNRNLDVAQIVKKNAFFASIGRMGRINTKTIFFGLYPEHPLYRCKIFLP